MTRQTSRNEGKKTLLRRTADASVAEYPLRSAWNTVQILAERREWIPVAFRRFVIGSRTVRLENITSLTSAPEFAIEHTTPASRRLLLLPAAQTDI